EIGRIIGRLVRPLGREFVVVRLGHDHDAFGDPVGGLEDFPFRIDRVEYVTHAVTSALRLLTAAWIRFSRPCDCASTQIDRNSASDWAAATRSSNWATAGLIISSRVTFRFPA